MEVQQDQRVNVVLIEKGAIGRRQRLNGWYGGQKRHERGDVVAHHRSIMMDLPRWIAVLLVRTIEYRSTLFDVALQTAGVVGVYETRKVTPIPLVQVRRYRHRDLNGDGFAIQMPTVMKALTLRTIDLALFGTF